MKYPELSEEEVEEVRQHVVVDSVVKNGEIKETGDKRFIRMAGTFVNIDDLHIDLIDSVKTGALSHNHGTTLGIGLEAIHMLSVLGQ